MEEIPDIHLDERLVYVKMMKILSDYEAYKNYYHFVGSTKYRKDLFVDQDIRMSLMSIVQEIMEKKGIEVVAIAVAYNHMHVLLRTDLSPSNVAQILFGVSSRLLRKKYPILVEEVKNGLWGGRSCRAIKDEVHLENCRSYIMRHQPDNTKLDEI